MAAYLDIAGYRLRSKIDSGDVDWVQSKYPGYIDARIAVISSRLNARLKKRYAVPFSSPVPEIVLGWLVAVLDVDVWEKRGVNPQDPQVLLAKEERDNALAEVKEAADSDVGLFDLPTNDAAGDSAVTQGGPMFYSEGSPYVWMDQQAETGRGEDIAGTGTSATVDR